MYMVEAILPHVHVESSHFRKFMDKLSPGYQCKSKRTIKRSILQMYMVMRKLVIDLLSTINSRFSITFDGLSNNSLKGFYLVTFHWVCHETITQKSILLDFLNVLQGHGVGRRCGQAIFNRLSSFGISSKLLTTMSIAAVMFKWLQMS